MFGITGEEDEQPARRSAVITSVRTITTRRNEGPYREG